MTSADLTPGLATGRWTVLLPSARAGFRCRDVLHRPVTGTLAVTTGHVDVDARGVPVEVAAELDLTTVATGSARRDHDLRGRRMLDADGSARLTFQGGPATTTGTGRWTLPATLAMKGASCPVEVTVQVVGHHAVATATVDRRALGIRAPRLLVGTDVHLTVEAELLPPGS